MWEKTDGINNDDNKKILFPILLDTKKDKMSPVLLIQIAICIIFIAAAVFLSKINEKNKTIIKQYTQMLIEQGVDINDENEIARLVSNIIESVTKPLAQGGFYAVKDNSVTPINCTFNNYKISINPSLPVNGVVTSMFGNRKNPINKKNDFHTGLDIAAPKNTAIYSSFSGIVIETGTDKVRGNYVFVKHSDNLITKYSHLNLIFVDQGQIIKQGEIIGGVGSTGMSTGYHLHFEIMIDDKYVDPYKMLNLPVNQVI